MHVEWRRGRSRVEKEKKRGIVNRRVDEREEESIGDRGKEWR